MDRISRMGSVQIRSFGERKQMPLCRVEVERDRVLGNEERNARRPLSSRSPAEKSKPPDSQVQVYRSNVV